MAEMLIVPESNVMPAKVRRAVGVLWLSLLLGLVAALVGWRQVHHKNPVFSVVVQILVFGFFALLIWKMSKGRNWARFTWLILFASGFVLDFLITLFSRTHRGVVFRSPFSTVVFVLQTAIQLYATFLLLSSQGRIWFLRKQ